MSEFGSDLHRFGLDPSQPPDQAQWSNLCRLIRALVNNPMLSIGTENSLIKTTENPRNNMPDGIEEPKPYDVTLGGTAASGYHVTIAHGWVRTIKTGTGEALDYREAKNHYETGSTTKLLKHAITVGQSAYVKVLLDKEGRVQPSDESVIIVIGANLESENYQPRVDDLTSIGVDGVMHFKLATFEEATPKLKLKNYLAGDHIHWSPPMPAIKSTMVTGDEAEGEELGVLPKKWDNGANAYFFRALIAKCGLRLTQTDDKLELKPGGNSFRVRLWETVISGGYDVYYSSIDVDAGTSPIAEFWVLNGVWYTTEPSGWSVCGGSEYPVYDVSWVVPTTGGPGA